MKLSKIKLPLVMFFVLMGCSESNQVSEAELYGNSFIKIDNSDFSVPSNWNTHDLFNNSFQINLPPYMHVTKNYPVEDNGASIIFNYRDTANTDKFHYGRVGIDYYYREIGDFNKASENISYSDQVNMLSPIVERSLKVYVKGFPDGEIINGPFYTSHFLYDKKSFYAYDAFFRRKGIPESEGPVSCHIFLLMNKTEAAVMTVSFFDKDSVLFENLFNVVKTFKWTKYNN